MSSVQVCRQCGQEVRSDLIDGLCPKCVARIALRFEWIQSAGTEDSETDSADGFGASELAQSSKQVRRFGDYELLEEIARGGMGVVYRARQRGLDRIVAVKMLLFPNFAGPEATSRFRVEAEAAAKLQHPHIVAIHEIGEEEGQPYFSMDHVEGVTLEQLARDKAIEPKRAAAYLRTIAEAVHYAHERGIVHRDLKPSNVLIDSADRPRITDFGLAKVLTGNARLTMTGQILGSPGYIPPEQTEGKDSAVGFQADVYALGAVLYYLLTRRAPFEGGTLTEILERVRHTEPVAPRLLAPSVPRDLETICLKCLRKEPDSRYTSAQALAEDLGRFLTGEPIRARPVTAAERLWSWCRRKPALATVGAIALLLLLTLAIGGPLAAARYRRLAEEQRRLLYASDMKAAYQAIEMNNMGQAVDYLKRHEPSGNQPDLREFTWHYLRRLCRPYEEIPALDHGIAVVYLAVTRDGKRLVAGGPLGRITMWDIESRSLLHRFNTGEEVLTGQLTFSPDGRFLVATGHGPWISSVGLQIWDITGITNWKRVYHTTRDLAGYDGEFSPDGSLLAVPTGGAIVLMTVRESPTHPLRSITGSVRTARFSPDGSRMVTGAWDTNHAILWRVADGAKLGVFTNHTVSGTVHAAVFSPDGQEIASVGQDDTVRLWDASSLEELGSYEHDVSPGALDFSREDWLVASGGKDGLVKLWDVKAGTVRELRGHSKTVKAVKFIPGAGILASGSMDRTVRLWNLNEQQPNDILEGRPNIHLPIAFHSPIAFSPPESGLIATASMNGEDILLWDKESGDLRKRLRGSASDVLTVRSPEEATQMDALEIDRFGVVDDLAWSSNGVLAAARTFDSSLTGTGTARYRIEFWDFRRGVVTNSFEGRAPICFPGDGRLFAWHGAEKGTIHWRDFGTGRSGNAQQKVFRGVRMGLALSSDGRQLAANNAKETVIWDTATGAVSAILSLDEAAQGPLDSMVFSPDDTLLIAGGEYGDIYVWALAEREEPATLTSHPGRVASLAISPDGKTLATGDANGLIKLWTFERPRESFGSRRQVRELLTLQANEEGVDNLRFSPDGSVLASCGADGTVRLWRAR